MGVWVYGGEGVGSLASFRQKKCERRTRKMRFLKRQVGF